MFSNLYRNMYAQKGPPPAPPPKRKDHKPISKTVVGAGHNVARALSSSYTSQKPEQLDEHDDKNVIDDDSSRINAAFDNLPTPDAVIGIDVVINGEFHFDKLLKIDGKFEGTLVSSGDLIVGKKGILLGDVTNIRKMIVDGGQVVGSISVRELIVMGKAIIKGDVTSELIELIGTDIMLMGAANVHPDAPDHIDPEGNIVSTSQYQALNAPHTDKGNVKSPNSKHRSYSNKEEQKQEAESRRLALLEAKKKRKAAKKILREEAERKAVLSNDEVVNKQSTSLNSLKDYKDMENGLSSSSTKAGPTSSNIPPKKENSTEMLQIAELKPVESEIEAIADQPNSVVKKEDDEPEQTVVDNTNRTSHLSENNSKSNLHNVEHGQIEREEEDQQEESQENEIKNSADQNEIKETETSPAQTKDGEGENKELTPGESGYKSNPEEISPINEEVKGSDGADEAKESTTESNIASNDTAAFFPNIKAAADANKTND